MDVDKWDLELLQSVEWKAFEDLCAEVLRHTKYRPETTGPGADGGIDIYLYKGEDSTPFAGVQCKAWRNRSIGVKEIRELYGIVKGNGLKHGIFITCRDFTIDAREFAEGKALKLIDGLELVKILNRLPKEKRQTVNEKILTENYTTPTCPQCNIKMVLRTARKGKNAGSQFWGCPTFPRCTQTIQLSRQEKNRVAEAQGKYVTKIVEIDNTNPDEPNSDESPDLRAVAKVLYVIFMIVMFFFIIGVVKEQMYKAVDSYKELKERRLQRGQEAIRQIQQKSEEARRQKEPQKNDGK